MMSLRFLLLLEITIMEGGEKVNVNIDVNTTSDTSRKVHISNGSNKKEKFKNVLDNYELLSKNFSSENIHKKYNKDQNLNKTNNENKSDDDYKTIVESSIPKDLNNTCDNKELDEKIINFVEVAIDALKQDTEESPKKLIGKGKSTDEMAQIEQLLQLLGSMFQSVNETPETKTLKKDLNSINIEKLIGGEKLAPEAKSMLKKSLSEIVDLLEKSKENKEMLPQILDVLQKLTTKVRDVKGDLSLLKVVNEKTTVEGNTTKDLNNAYDNNKLNDKIVNFVEVAIDALKQKTYETSATIHQGSKLNFINLEQVGEEQLIDIEKLEPEAKSILRKNLSEIVDLLEKSKENKEMLPKILDVLQKLTTKVSDVKRDLSLLKVVNEKTTVEGNTTKDFNNAYDNNKLEAKIVNFVEVAINALKQNTEKSIKELAVEGKSIEKVVQIQKLLKSLSSMFQKTYETSATIHQGSKLNFINLEQVGEEQLIDIEKLEPEAKSILRKNLSEIVDLLEKSKENKEMLPKILDVLEKLTIKVRDVKGDLSLLKVGNEKTTVEGSNSKDFNNAYDNSKLNEKIINFIEVAIDALKQNTYETPATIHQGNELTPINLEQIGEEQLIGGEKLTPMAKNMLKNNLTEIVALIEKSKGNNETSSQILDVLQRLTTEEREAGEDLSLLKVPGFKTVIGDSEDKSIKDNLLTKIMKQSTKTTSEILPKNQMQSSSNAGQGNKFSGNRSFEEKFLNNLIGEDKDETKISKAVNFMNQFEPVKTIDTPKVLTPNNLVIDRNNVEVDVIKTIKFMEINNIKDLIVKMNPKELGEITIKLTMESGIMKANILAQNKDTYNLLNHNIQDISDRLKNMDIKIQSLDINIYEDSTFFSKDSSEKNNNERQNNSSKTNMSLEEDEDIPISDNYFIEGNQVNKFV